MIYDDKYHYFLCDDYYFNSMYLSLEDKKRYSKYILIFYKDNGSVLNKRIYTYDDINNFNYEVLAKYYVEEIDITGTNFESEYSYSKVFKVNNIGIYKKVLYDSSFDCEVKFDDKEVYDLINSYDSKWSTINEKEFFSNQ